MNPDIEKHFRAFYLQSICHRYFENQYLGVYYNTDKYQSYQCGYHVKLLDFTLEKRSSRYVYLGLTVEEACRFIAKLPPRC